MKLSRLKFMFCDIMHMINILPVVCDNKQINFLCVFQIPWSQYTKTVIYLVFPCKLNTMWFNLKTKVVIILPWDF